MESFSVGGLRAEMAHEMVTRGISSQSEFDAVGALASAWAGGRVLLPPIPDDVFGDVADDWPKASVQTTLLVLSGVHNARGFTGEPLIQALVASGHPAEAVAGFAIVPYDPVVDGVSVWGMSTFKGSEDKPSRSPPPEVVRAYAPMLAAHLRLLTNLAVVVTMDGVSREILLQVSLFKSHAEARAMLRDLVRIETATKALPPTWTLGRNVRAGGRLPVGAGDKPVQFIHVGPIFDKNADEVTAIALPIVRLATPQVATATDINSRPPPVQMPRVHFMEHPGSGALVRFVDGGVEF